MKLSNILLALSMLTYTTKAQTNEEVVRKIADQVIKETILGFESVENKNFYAKATDIPETVKVKYASPYTGWHYAHGVLNLAMMNLGRQLNEPKYFDYAAQHIKFGFENYKTFEQRFKHDVKHYTYPYGEFFTMDELDDFGAISASIIEVYQKYPKPEYKAYVEKAANHLIKERSRMSDGTFVRSFPRQMTLWADDLYMSVPFLSNMYALTGDKKYLNEAVLQVKNFDKYLWDDSRKIYWHTYYTDLNRNGVAHWGRCNGWILLSKIRLLDQLKDNDPQKKEILQLLEKQLLGLALYQDSDGLWHQVLDKESSYSESSCTSMFVYGVAHAVNNGWLDKRYATIAKAGWEGLKKLKLNEQYQLKDICVGTGIQDNLPFYFNRPVATNEKHGTGPLLDAGVEILKLEKLLGSAK